jgi:Type IIA topoisomerase (DNA gyrase/topo II, topoisomerase IV), A subunit
MTRTAIIVTQLPYQVNKSSLLEKIADMVNDKKIDGIADLRDESDRDGIRVVIELKRDAVPAVVQVSNSCWYLCTITFFISQQHFTHR